MIRPSRFDLMGSFALFAITSACLVAYLVSYEIAGWHGVARLFGASAAIVVTIVIVDEIDYRRTGS